MYGKMKTELEQTQKSPKKMEKMNIANVIIWMTKNGYEPTTIKKVGKLLRNLERSCNTSDPEAVKLHIGKRKVSNGHKQNLVEAYACFIKSVDETWQQPFYPRYSKKRARQSLTRPSLTFFYAFINNISV